MAADAPAPRHPTFAQRLVAAWPHRRGLALWLWPLSQLYRLALWLRRLFYRLGWARTHRLPVPVVVVGNVVVGGAGKTPTVIALVRDLRAKGRCPGVISRGHGRSDQGCVEVRADSDSAVCGDEPLLIAQATGVPLVVGRDRVAAGQMLLTQHPEVDVVVSDDGMQHWALQRDITLVVFDARGIGNGWLLPAGMLREPWPAPAWGQGPLYLLYNPAPHAPEPPPLLAAAYRSERTLAGHALAPDGRTRDLAQWAQADAVQLGALAGIAQPEAFFDMLRAHGLALQHTLALPDHASGEQLQTALARHSPTTVWFCTEKDAVKLFPRLQRSANSPQVWAVPLRQTLPPELLSRLQHDLDALSSPHGHQTP